MKILLTVAKLHEIMSTIIQPKIVIIGAGAAGIAAASKLIKNGITDVTILEAENRIGGRINSVPFGGTIVDLGAQWVHGEENNIVYEMVKDLDVVGHNRTANYETLSFFTSNNSKLNRNLTSRFHEIASEILEDRPAIYEHGGTLGDYFRNHYNDRISTEFGNNKDILDIAKMVEEWISKFMLCYDPAESLDQISVNSLVKYQQCSGDPLIHWKNKGYATIFDVLEKKSQTKTEQLQLKKNVLLNKEVNKIVWKKQNPDQPKQVEIKCIDGSFYHADHVIVTLPVAVLKHLHVTLFEPNLPNYKINCVENIELGQIHKIILKFPKKWWPDDVQDFSFLWTEEDKRKLLKEFPHGPVHNSRSWLEDIFGFYTIDCHPEILLGWMVGPMAKEVELLPDDVVQKASLFLLRKFVGKHYNVLEPENIIRSKWGANPHFYGTWSYVSTKMEEYKATNSDLARPLTVDGKEVVLFAGEATHSKYFSTVHGAIETGYREADRLIIKYRNFDYHQTVIVGAGFAGLGAAITLFENKINDFLIVEAEKHAGGRIKSIYVDGRPLDLGAQWIHGKDNALYELALRNNLLSENKSEEGIGSYVRSTGELVDPYIVKIIDFKIGQILEKCAKFVNSDKHPRSVGEYLDQSFTEYIQNQDVDNNILEHLQELYDWHIRFQVIDNSCTGLSRLSAKSWGEYICYNDVAHYNLKYGYQSLIKVILEKLPNDCISYKSEVAKLRFQENNTINIQLKNGKNIVCDHLILTSSIGVLKEFQGLSDILPENLMKAIENMGFAGICKIYLFFEDKWWKDSRGFQLLWAKDCNFSEKHSWLRHLTGFDEVFNHPKALMTWVGGDVVQEVESLHTDEIGKQCTGLLRRFLPNYFVPLPSKVIRTKWISNTFVKGSYCHITPECDDTGSVIRTLGEPVVVHDVPRIVLAGEAIHPSHYSTTHGAFESGQDQAKIIAGFISGLK